MRSRHKSVASSPQTADFNRRTTMGLLDNVLGGLGDDAAGGLSDLLKGQGGVAGLAEKFGQSGLGDVAASWIGKGGNAAISPEQIASVLGSGPIADFAARLGVSPEQAGETLAGLLPEAVDRLTPNGSAEGADDLLGGLLNNLPGGLGDALGGLFKR
ncbi:YidB family protein [Brevundimonas sp. NPDC003935]|uniref:YidB family protein n=1 Tax=unclassified Brevundimonas TaxID=2622653 RepID=UPI0036A2A051